jgi:hypothetical protein
MNTFQLAFRAVASGDDRLVGDHCHEVSGTVGPTDCCRNAWNQLEICWIGNPPHFMVDRAVAVKQDCGQAISQMPPTHGAAADIGFHPLEPVGRAHVFEILATRVRADNRSMVDHLREEIPCEIAFARMLWKPV